MRLFLPFRRRVAAGAISVLGLAAGARSSDLLVVYGAGSAGLWGTELTFANRTADETSVGVFDAPFDVCPPSAHCYSFATLPPRGTVVMDYYGNLLRTGVGAAYIFSGSNPLTVSVQARAHQASGSSVDLPVFSVADLLALDPESLVLPGARRGPGARTNLLVANVFRHDGTRSGPVDIGLEVIGADGTLLGSSTLSIPYGETIFITDVVEKLGVTELENGQVKVTKLGGDGVMWATMTVARADGSLSTSIGATP